MFSLGTDDVLGALFGAAGGSLGMMGGHPGTQRARRSRDVTRTLPVTLSDLYNGKTMQLERRRTILCVACAGSGVKSSRSQSRARRVNVCPHCRGSGARMMVRQMGMMMQQMQIVCPACNGSGTHIDPRDVCERCAGQKTEEVDAPVTVVIERGMAHGQQLVYQGMADVHADEVAAGDLIIVLQQVKHDTYVRQEHDLHMRKRLTLAEALCGFQFKLQHLDGRELVVRRTRGEVTAPGSTYCVRGEGMPILAKHHSQPDAGTRPGNSGRYGDLVLEFDVAYPDSLSEAQVATLREALPPPHSVDVATEEADGGGHSDECCYVTRQELSELRREIAKEEEDEATDEAEEQPSVGCAQQ